MINNTMTRRNGNEWKKRIEVDEFWVDSTIIEAGDYVFIGYCMGNEGQSIEEQIEGAFTTLENRLAMVWYPVRKAFTSDFIREGICFQIDAIAYIGRSTIKHWRKRIITNYAIIGRLIYPNMENGIVISEDRRKLIEMAEKYISEEKAEHIKEIYRSANEV